MKLRWSVRALKDAQQLRAYIAQDSPFYAQQFMARLGARLNALTDFPHSGRLVPEAERDDIREVIYQGYRAIYQLKEAQQEIVLVTLVHGSRDLTATSNQAWNQPIQ